ncbi:hypothetical protein A1O1_01450 [Capronia coronata CBS 617.96]|uniref:C2 domain-containing protein n=1 Tax=Capronia coronata CBS 617.96 TaxID=1182541 RepID=W9ZPB4_9EURO|nr:uncharacterized protein A1O1_01450 [Capronia coronata CBS 617.96]EXJ96324.1 hypothetical protein A1O1_01450 [Capronia coronata CBS 617.96]
MTDNDTAEPVLRRGHQTDKIVPKIVGQADKLQQKYQGQTGTGSSDKKGPPGGFDPTPLPSVPPGYTLRITFHKAENLPFADLKTLSSDPYILAILQTDVPKRHKQDPDVQWRTPTIHRNTNPEWNTEWIVANVPKSGFFLKCRLYDEDPSDHDDRLGNAHIVVHHIDDNWKGMSHERFNLKKRMGSKRAYTLRGAAALVSRRVKMGGHLIVSVENLGRTKAESGGHVYTVGPLAWSRHFSPLIGRLVGIKDTEQGQDGKKTEKYNFQAIQLQLQGPVPADLYHRYVEFRPFIAGMFTAHSLRGRLLNRALHHQHARIYNYDRTTKYGLFQEPCMELTKQFLEFVHYDEGGRIFTYVLTLDAQMRFTETGKEFGVDLLSKHTMHSDVSIYIAFSGEFFIRRIRQAHLHRKDKNVDPASGTHPPAPDPEDTKNGNGIKKNNKRKDNNKEGAQSRTSGGITPSRDPSDYELIIDNDSGTYRPNAQKLPLLREYLSHNFPGLKVVTLDCQADEEKMKKLKNEQRERKKQSGQQVMYLQNLSMSSLSSSDEERLEAGAPDGQRKESTYKHGMHKLMDGGKDQHHDGGSPESGKVDASAERQEVERNGEGGGGGGGGNDEPAVHGSPAGQEPEKQQ